MRFQQATGKLFDETDALVGVGWAGHLDGKNNPTMQNVEDVGPLPVGIYTISDPINSAKLGPLAFSLVPEADNQMFGRAGFFIHGASISCAEMSSDGCIIMPRPTREMLSKKISGLPVGNPLRQLVVY